MAAFHHGSRVTDWATLCRLATWLLAAALPASKEAAAQPTTVPQPQPADEQAAGRPTAAMPPAGPSSAAVVATVEDALTAQTLRLLQAVLLGHCQVRLQ